MLDYFNNMLVTKNGKPMNSFQELPGHLTLSITFYYSITIMENDKVTTFQVFIHCYLLVNQNGVGYNQRMRYFVWKHAVNNDTK